MPSYLGKQLSESDGLGFSRCPIECFLHRSPRWTVRVPAHKLPAKQGRARPPVTISGSSLPLVRPPEDTNFGVPMLGDPNPARQGARVGVGVGVWQRPNQRTLYICEATQAEPGPLSRVGAPHESLSVTVVESDHGLRSWNESRLERADDGCAGEEAAHALPFETPRTLKQQGLRPSQAAELVAIAVTGVARR